MLPVAANDSAALQQVVKGVNELLDKQSALHEEIQALHKKDPNA